MDFGLDATSIILRVFALSSMTSEFALLFQLYTCANCQKYDKSFFVIIICDNQGSAYMQIFKALS